MELFKNIRLSIAKRSLRNKSRKLRRRKSFCNIKSARKIGVVWDASNADDFQVIASFQQRMAEREIGVEVIGYYPGKVLPDRYTAVRYLACLKKGDLNMFYIPDNMETTSFINKPYNILLDLNRNSYFPLTFISALSQAEFKVGLYKDSKSEEIFDLLIETEKGRNLEYRLEQAVLYLEMINKG